MTDDNNSERMITNSIDTNTVDNTNDDSLSKTTNLIEKFKNIIDVATQTDSNWLEELRHELLLSFQSELGVKEQVTKKQKSRAGTIRSQVTKRSVAKSKMKAESILREDTEIKSYSEDSTSTLPVYPEPRIDDEYGISLFSSSEDEDMALNYEHLTAIIRDNTDAPKISSNEEEMKKAIEKNIIFDAGLPMSLKASKELGSSNNRPMLSVDAFLASAMIPKQDEVCEFCRKPLIPIPSIHEQVDSNIDQAKLFCCQEFRDLVDFALAHRQNELKTNADGKDKSQMIDVSPHKSHKNLEELAEEKAKSEKKIRERLLERQHAALIAAQTSRTKIDGPRRAYTEIPSVLMLLDIRSALDEENDLTLTRRMTDSVMARQMKVINYQLSSYKFMEDGWTIRPPTISNDEVLAKEEKKDFLINMDYSNLIHDIFGQMGLSNECSSVGVIRQYYPDGQLFLVLFPTGSASIYYPSGNLAISIIREALDAPMICVIQEDFSTIENTSKILGIINTNGFGSFSHETGKIKILFDTLMGIEILPNGTRKRQWYWDGKPHVHAPPFQPLFFSINRYVGVRISSQNGIYINFFSITRQIHINVGFKSKIPERVQQKMHAMVKMEMEKMTKPLKEIETRISNYIGKCHEALGHPNLLLENKWPIKPYKLAKINNEKKTVLSLSLVQ